eukprot:jgi/Chrzof1/7660/Cz02g32010.t1
MWPAPGQNEKTVPKAHPALGASLNPLPALQVKGKPISAATIRTGPGYLEVPFVATHENQRGRGFGRCVLEAIESVARAVGIQRLLLCSTAEESVKSTWRHLGFDYSTEELLASWDVQDSDLVHMQNTVQMHKLVPPTRCWKPLLIRHQQFVCRTYMPLDQWPLSSKSYGLANGALSGYKSDYKSEYRDMSTATSGAGTDDWQDQQQQQPQKQQQQQQQQAYEAEGRSASQPAGSGQSGQ